MEIAEADRKNKTGNQCTWAFMQFIIQNFVLLLTDKSKNN